jgi:predicted enzyme related to lactoylglutathione lyase
MSAADRVVPVPGTPCWVNLMVTDLPAARAFYSAVLGWEFRQGSLGDGFSVAFAKGHPVAGIGARRPGLAPASVWTPYFGVPDADETADRIRERGATLAVGPMSLDTGRAAIAADRDGATFGFWQGPTHVWRAGESPGVRLDLQSPDVFEAAVFYGGVFGWAQEEPGGVEVSYHRGLVTAAYAGRTVATLRSTGEMAPEDRQEHPRWLVTFEVDDVERALSAAVANGGSRPDKSVAAPARSGFTRTLRDPDGCLFALSDSPAENR